MFQITRRPTNDRLVPTERLAILRELDEKTVASFGNPLRIGGWSFQLWGSNTRTKSGAVEGVFIVQVEAPRTFSSAMIGLNFENPYALVFSAADGKFLSYVPLPHRVFLFSIPLRIVKDVIPKRDLLPEVDTLLKRLKTGERQT